MNLVQAGSDETEDNRELGIDGGRIIWDEKVEGFAVRYGDIKLDYRKNFWNPGLSLTFGSSSCC